MVIFLLLYVLTYFSSLLSSICLPSPLLFPNFFCCRSKRQEVETGNYCGRGLCPLNFFIFSPTNPLLSHRTARSPPSSVVIFKSSLITLFRENRGNYQVCGLKILDNTVYEFYLASVPASVAQCEGWAHSCSCCLAVHWSRLYAD